MRGAKHNPIDSIIMLYWGEREFRWFRELSLLLLLSDIADGASGSASGAGMLTTNLESPDVAQSSMEADFSHAFQVFTELSIPAIGNQDVVLAFLPVTLPIVQPRRNIVSYFTFASLQCYLGDQRRFRSGG